MSEEKRIARNDILISLLCFIGGVIIGFLDGGILSGDLSGMVMSIVVSGAMFGGLRYGWKALTFITPNIFIIMPIIGWVIYFLIKLVIALVIASFIFVIKTIQNIMILCKK
jgi:hypothetical protein